MGNTIQASAIEEDDIYVPEAFAVIDDASANWVIRKITEARAYAERCAEWSQREQIRAKRAEEFFFFRYGRQLMAFAQDKIAEQSGRRKSVNFPAGALGFRKVAQRIVVDDNDAVLAWAKLNKPELVVISERLDKRGFNEMVQTTGEIPATGVHIEPARESFYVK